MNARQRRKDFRKFKIDQIFGAFCSDDDDDATPLGLKEEITEIISILETLTKRAEEK